MVNKYDNYELKKVDSLEKVPGTIKDGDGYIWDPSELPDKDFDDSKVPLEYRRLAIWMRSKLFGKDVRETIARLAEMFGLNFKELMASFESLDARQDAVEDFNTQVVQEMTDKDVISAPEIIEARGNAPKLNDRLNNHELLIDAHSVNPDVFYGDDYEKLQQAIDFILSSGQGGTIRIHREYNINGRTLILDNHKANAKDRQVLNFSGDGGSIIKHDGGFMFDSVKADIGDFFFNNITFKSIGGSNTTIVNGDTVIRVQFVSCHARDVDHIATAVARYLQSIHWTSGTIIGGKGYAFEAPCFYDFSYTSGAFTEHRDGFLLQTPVTTGSWSAMNGVRLTGSMVEGLSGKAIKVNRVEQMQIDGMYFENNRGGEIDFSDADYLDGLSISNCRFSEPIDSAVNAAINWGGRLIGVSTRNNFVRNIPFHDTTKVVKSKEYVVHSYQDVNIDYSRNPIASIDPENVVVKNNITQIYQDRDNVGDYNKPFSYTDLNDDYIRSGKYHINGSNYLNAPHSGWGFLEHNRYSHQYREQIFKVRGSGSSVIYQRTKNGSNDSDWTVWKQITQSLG